MIGFTKSKPTVTPTPARKRVCIPFSRTTPEAICVAK